MNQYPGATQHSTRASTGENQRDLAVLPNLLLVSRSRGRSERPGGKILAVCRGCAYLWGKGSLVRG